MRVRPIIVTKHAIEQYGRRKADSRPGWEIEEEIRECVRTGLERGYVYDRRPKGFVLYGRKNSPLAPGQRFVQCDRESSLGFIIKRSPDEGDIVVTTLTRAGVR